MTLFAKIDCGLARDPRLIAAGPLARLLYVQTVLYCRENLTDGELDRLLLPLVAVDIPQPAKHMATLVRVGALDVTASGWAIPAAVWARWNPTREQVDEIRRQAAQRKKEWRDKQLAAEGSS